MRGAGGRRAPIHFTAHEYIGAPVGGWSPDIPAWMLPADQAAELENFIIRPGKIRVRPSFKTVADLTSQIPQASPAGFIPIDKNTVIMSRRIYTPNYKIEPQNIHRVGVTLPPGPGFPDTPVESFAYVASPSGVTKETLSDPTRAPGWRHINFNGNTYALSYATVGAGSGGYLTYNDGITSWETEVLKVDKTTSTAYVTAPIGGFDITSWLGRVWILGGELGSGPPSTTALFYTVPIDSLTDVGSTSDWKDPVSGLVNKIEIDGNFTDAGVALASVPVGLLVFRINSVFSIRGTDPTTWVVRSLSKEVGCLDARSVIEMDNVVYWMSEQGFMVTNGTSVQNVSGALQDELYRQIATWNNAVFNNTGAWCDCTTTSDNKIMVSFGTYDDGDATNGYAMQGTFSALFDPQAGTWAKVTTAVNPTGAGGGLGPSVAAYGSMHSLGNTAVLQIEGTGTETRLSNPPALWDQSTTGGALVPITATWKSRSFQAALGERAKIQLKRMYADYAGYTDGAAATVDLKLVDRESSGAPLVDDSLALSTAASGPRQRFERDVQPEVADLGAEITMAGDSGGTGATSNSIPAAEVHGVGVEFQPTSDMRPVN